MTSIVDTIRNARENQKELDRNVYKAFLDDAFEKVTVGLAEKVSAQAEKGRNRCNIRKFNNRYMWMLNFDAEGKVVDPTVESERKAVPLDFLFNGYPDRKEDGVVTVVENEGRNFFHRFGLKSLREMIEEHYTKELNTVCVVKKYCPRGTYDVFMQLVLPVENKEE